MPVDNLRKRSPQRRRSQRFSQARRIRFHAGRETKASAGFR